MTDTTSYISQGWQEKAEQGKISKELVQPIPMLEQMVKEGKMGRKSGEGFYKVRTIETGTKLICAVRQVVARSRRMRLLYMYYVVYNLIRQYNIQSL
jgi:3-hydroxyacyl-CoA dehydrogenase